MIGPKAPPAMTGSIIPFLIVLAALVAIQLVWNRRVGPRATSPLWFAFSTTTAALAFTVSGGMGFGLQKGPPLLAESRWTGDVIWPQVWTGLLFATSPCFAGARPSATPIAVLAAHNASKMR